MAILILIAVLFTFNKTKIKKAYDKSVFVFIKGQGLSLNEVLNNLFL